MRKGRKLKMMLTPILILEKKKKEVPKEAAAEKVVPEKKEFKWEKKKAQENQEKPLKLSPYARIPYPQRLRQEIQNAIIQKKLPPELKESGSFSISIEIGNIDVGKSLCDLGASINLMPLSICKALGIHELKPTKVSLQLAERSIRRPDRIFEDVLVKIDKFIFPADFTILDMEEDAEIPLLLGRPFLATARAIIDVEQVDVIHDAILETVDGILQPLMELELLEEEILQDATEAIEEGQVVEKLEKKVDDVT
ncbi:uncharacterized protein LOC133316280 [Gastrolobium bilobum]|uniref:uncharacterized protein LOC133316280 n=1 Tax=Gastrolobium bilobum TaxID=150636 RepID=UPI002AB1B979|nr:uncharacterized protein LOC133316280 [Gastrolobium bilobum]